MYGWLLESVQYYIIRECGEEIWETILRESGARNNVFSATQQYPDTLMLRLACALARLVTKDPNSPVPSTPSSPKPKKSSIKFKPSWKSASVHNDGRSRPPKCPFTATNELTAETKKEIEAYNSLEEIRAKALSTNAIHEEQELNDPPKEYNNVYRGSLKIKLNCPQTERIAKVEEAKVEKKVEIIDKVDDKTLFNTVKIIELTNKDEPKSLEKAEKKDEEPSCSTSELVKKPSLSKISPSRKTSCTLALDIYRRRGSGVPIRPGFNSISLGDEKLKMMKEKFGTPDKVMHFFGRCFVKFFSYYGYDTMIRATGRYFCTFLQSVDSIHQRMRFSFPRMRSPLMQLTRSHIHGAELVYSSGRTGFTHYLMGQLYEIAEDIFSLKLKVSILKESMEGSYYIAVLRLEFDNSDYVQSQIRKKSVSCSLPPVHASLLLQLFPWGVLLDRKMKILKAGDKLIEAWGGPLNRIIKLQVSDILRLRKPKVPFTWEKVVSMQNMTFELELDRYNAVFALEVDTRRGSQGAGKSILLKGPIYFLEEIDALIFLCSPIFNNPQELSQAGVFLSDLNGHGLSKEMLLHKWEHLSRLELMFDKAESRSMSLEKSCRLLDQWKKKSDRLLYSMIPKAIAYHLKEGKDPEEANKSFDSVTIIFCGIPLSDAETRANVMHTVVDMNNIYSKIDRLLDSHKVYKVETVGTVYMLVSGAPKTSRTHAASAASAALAICQALPRLTIGMHSGPVVAGVLGRRVPRYCLVGDTVNTASRMQTSSEPGRIQISAETASQLPAGKFRLRSRGLIKVKGKGVMETFWLEGEVEKDEQHEALQLFSDHCGET